MNFWIENNKEITYNDLVNDLKVDVPSYDLDGYNYFFNLLIHLLKKNKAYDFSYYLE